MNKGVKAIRQKYMRARELELITEISRMYQGIRERCFWENLSHYESAARRLKLVQAELDSIIAERKGV